MYTFRDSKSRPWTIELTVGAVKRVKALVGVDLLAIDDGDPPLHTRLITDLALTCDVIYALVKPQAEAAGVSDEQFGEGLGGDAIRGAVTAFLEALVDFFRQLGRPELEAKVAALTQAMELASGIIAARVKAVNVQAVVMKAMDEETAARAAPGPMSTPSPASSESTPTA